MAVGNSLGIINCLPILIPLILTRFIINSNKFSADSRQPMRSRFPPPKHIQQQPQPLLKGVNASENVQNQVVETDEGHEGEYLYIH